MIALPTILFLIGTLPGFSLGSREAPRSEPRTGAIRHHRKNWCSTCERTAAGRIKRNSQARAAFMQRHPCPATHETVGACPGFIVDHIIPLRRGGPDQPWNMQWQSKLDARAKDRVE
jgi:hypothetical protein